MEIIIIPAIFFILAIALVVSCANIVPQENAYVIERFGRYRTTWDAGIHFKFPFVDHVRRRVLLKEQVADFAPQPVITKDNVTMQIDSVVYFKVMNPHDYAYGVENPIMAMENLTATTLRNIIGDMELDQTLTSREAINSQMLQTIDLATDPWGIKINRVEVKNITPPGDIQRAMEKQMRAERERREAIIRAEGEKKSAVLTAEGNKQATMLEAEAKKQATILEAEAQKQAAICAAEGEAQAIKMVQQATADGIKMLVEAQPNQEVIALKSLDSFVKAADGQATKIIIPSEIASIAGLASSVKELTKQD